MHRLCSLSVLVGAAALAACNAGVRQNDSDAAVDASNASDAAVPDAMSTGTPAFPVPVCEGDHAPIVTGTGRGTTACVAVGAIAAPSTEHWPDVTQARLPLVYVDPNAAAGGTGSSTSPFTTIAMAASALDAMGNGTIVLSSGTHAVTDTIAFTHDVGVLGFGGSDGSIITSPPNAPAFDVATSAVTVDISHAQIHAAATLTGPAIRASNGANLTIRDVTIDGAALAIQLTEGSDITSPGAHLDAQALTVTNTSDVAIHVGARGDALLRSVRIDGARVGIKSTGSSLTVREAHVTNFRAAGLSADYSSRTGGGVLSLDSVSIVNGTGLGAWLGGAALAADFTHVLVGGTHAITGMAGSGMGLLVTAGAKASLDTTITADAQQGFGSMFVANDGTGMLFDRGAQATVRGVFVASNLQSGAVIQATANVAEIGYSYFIANHGSSLVVSTGGILAGLLCDGFYQAMPGNVAFTSGTQLLLDGVLIQPQNARYTVVISGNTFQDNPRYGLLAVGVDAVLMNNVFANNPSGAAVVDGTARGTQAGDVDTTTPAAGLMSVPPGSLSTGGAP